MKQHFLAVLGSCALAACGSGDTAPDSAPESKVSAAERVLPEIRYYEIADT